MKPAPSTLPGNSAYPESVTRLIAELAKLPGVGRRSAERLAFFVLKSPKDDALLLARAIADVKQRVRHCSICYNLADQTVEGTNICAICTDERRDRSRVMVVEQPKDLIVLEQTGAYKGIYHVLMGHIAPLDGVTPGDLTIDDLIGRVQAPARNAGGVSVAEVVLALNPTLESDGTALYLSDALGKIKASDGAKVRVTRLARGVPTGLQLEYASKAVLADAIQERRGVE